MNAKQQLYAQYLEAVTEKHKTEVETVNLYFRQNPEPTDIPNISDELRSLCRRYTSVQKHLLELDKQLKELYAK